VTEPRRYPDDIEEERNWVPWIVALIGVVVLIVLLVVLVNLLGDRDPDVVITETPTPVEEPEPVEPAPDADDPVVEPTPPPPGPAVTPAPGVEEQEGPDPVHLSGTGSATTDPVEHEGGLALLRMRHAGVAFSLRIIDADGEEVEDFEVDRAEGYQGSRAVGLEAGVYRLQVTADDDWDISFEQPRYVAGPALPVELEGRNDTATQPFETAGGDIRFAWAAEDEPLAFDVLTAEGEAVATDLGTDPAGEETVDLPAGLYLLDVRAIGIWRVDVS
jgi:hypothetical protein